MTQAREPDDRDAIVNRELRGLNRRLDRLEYSQISPQEWNGTLDRIYDEIASSRAEMRSEILAVNSKLDSLDAKSNIIMRHITGEGNNPTP